MKRSRLAKRRARNQLPEQAEPPTAAFLEHVKELRKRLFYVAVSVIGFAVAAYFVQQHIVAALLRPAKAQQFIYTTPGGGIDFLLRVCLYTGLVISIPVIVYQLLKYLEPLIKKDAKRFIAWGSFVSGLLAVAGILFGYFLGLPAALHFLLNQFTTDRIHALISIQSYLSFVMLYMVGSALIFQVPLVLVMINRIKPLKPGKLLKHERWVILVAVIAGGIINPSPNVTDQLMLAVPMILTYQIGVFLVWRANRKTRRSKKVLAMRAKDDQARAERQTKFSEAQYSLEQRIRALTAPVAPVQAEVTASAPVPAPVVVSPSPAPPATQIPAVRPGRPGTARRKYFDFSRRSYIVPSPQVE